MKGNTIYNEPLVIVFHYIPQCSSKFSRGERNRDCHCEGKATTTAHFHEEGVPPFDIPRPAQSL